jgi:hypothetical protein
MNSDDLCNAIYRQLGGLRSGTLSFWGDWFGRPHENVHRIVGADSLDSATVIYFDHAESLIIDSPRGWSLNHGKFIVRQAERVRFNWFYYGRVPGPETLKFVEYRWNSGDPTFTSDFQPTPVPKVDGRAPAVQLHVDI